MPIVLFIVIVAMVLAAGVTSGVFCWQTPLGKMSVVCGGFLLFGFLSFLLFLFPDELLLFVTAILAMVLVAWFMSGVFRWRTPFGKTTVVVGGLLVLALLAVTLVVFPALGWTWKP